MFRHRLRPLLALIAMPLASPLFAGTLQADARLSYDDNINLASYAADRRSSVITRLHAGWQGRSDPMRRPLLTLTAGVDAANVASASGLSAAGVEFEAGALWRAGRAFAAPTVGLLVAGGHREFESDLRDSDWARTRAVAHLRWTTRLAAQASVYAQMQRAADPVFDHDRIGAEAGADWSSGHGSTLFLDLGLARGDVTISATPPYPGAQHASRIAADDVFTGENAYRIDARIIDSTLGFQQRITPMLSAQVKLRHADVRADGGSRYASNIAEVSVRAVWR